mgnify:CR=1 FL=1
MKNILIAFGIVMFTLFILSFATRNKFERKLDEYNHTMELIRTIIPVGVLILQIIILVKLI